MEVAGDTRRDKPFRSPFFWAFVSVVVLLALVVFVIPRIRGAIAEREVAKAIIANLYSASAGTPPTPKRYGATIRAEDGSWVVVDYRDTHDGTAPYDIAFALCSDGTWLISDDHHCAAFGFIQSRIDELAKLNEAAIDVESVQWRDEFVARCREDGVQDLVFPSTLADAKRALMSLEKRFVQIAPPPRP